MNIKDAVNRVFTQIIPMWEKARIPTKAKQDVIIKIKDLYNERQLLNKHRQRATPANLRNQVEYTRKMYALFDIAHADADFLIKIDEDRQFLHQQRVDRSGSFGSFDKSLAVCERTAATRAADRPQTTERHTAPQQTTDRDRWTRINRDKRSSSPVLPSTPPRTKRPKLSQKVAAVLGYTNTSVRKSAMIMASVLNEAGSSSSVMSRGTIRRRRQKRRVELANEIRSDYDTHDKVHCTLGWKLLPDVAGAESSTLLVERLAILVTSTSDGTTKLLGVLKLHAGTGETAAMQCFS